MTEIELNRLSMIPTRGSDEFIRKFDAKGNLVELIEKKVYGYKCTYEYDDLGLLIKQDYYNVKNDSEPYEFAEFKYNDKNELRGQKVTRGDVSTNFVYLYKPENRNESGFWTKREVFENDKHIRTERRKEIIIEALTGNDLD